MKFIPHLLFSLTLAVSAFAQTGHNHAEKGPKGGQMEDAAGLHVELVAKDKAITVYVYDDKMKPKPTQGYNATALVTNGANKETVTLKPEGETLVGATNAPIAKGTTVSVSFKTGDGKTGQARFK